MVVAESLAAERAKQHQFRGFAMRGHRLDEPAPSRWMTATVALRDVESHHRPMRAAISVGVSVLVLACGGSGSGRAVAPDTGPIVRTFPEDEPATAALPTGLPEAAPATGAAAPGPAGSVRWAAPVRNWTAQAACSLDAVRGPYLVKKTATCGTETESEVVSLRGVSLDPGDGCEHVVPPRFSADGCKLEMLRYCVKPVESVLRTVVTFFPGGEYVSSETTYRSADGECTLYKRMARLL